MPSRLSFNLHVLTARLDRAADRILRAEHGVSYSRFLALTLVGVLGVSTQRALAEGLGVTEPSVSRMVGALVVEGLLEARPSPAGGRARQLSLTSTGQQLVAGGLHVIEDRFAELVKLSDVPYEQYNAYTERLLATLDGVERQSES
jgi:DNA-binding MarR family transcriptional regulator